MLGMPPKLTASTGLDALAHAIESYMGTLTNEFIQFQAEKAIDEIFEYLPRAVENGQDMEARKKMAVAASVAGYLLIYGHTCAGHSIGQTLGGYFNIPHGTACAYALPWCVRIQCSCRSGFYSPDRSVFRREIQRKRDAGRDRGHDERCASEIQR